MKILVTGANGQLGNALRLLARDSRDRFVFTDVVDAPGVETVRLDITDAAAVRAFLKAEKVDVTVNCAAYTNVEAAEDHEALAELLNATAVENLAKAVKENGGLLIHISTDYVFGAEPYNTPCREEQKGTPTGAYGRTKLHGEEALRRAGCRFVIIRTGWLYSEYGKNFVKTMLDLTATRPQLKVVIDQVGTPTYAGDLAKVILQICHSGQSPCHSEQSPCHSERSEESVIYHYSNEGVCSWFDFAKAIAAYSGHTSCDIQPCRSADFPSKVHRPAYSVLDKTKIKAALGISIPYWTDSLQHCIDHLKQH